VLVVAVAMHSTWEAPGYDKMAKSKDVSRRLPATSQLC
jgi:hypothetical protein